MEDLYRVFSPGLFRGKFPDDNAVPRLGKSNTRINCVNHPTSRPVPPRPIETYTPSSFFLYSFSA